VSRIVVVGAGVGGLAAAARLAAQGHEVTVCEQAPAVGGKLARVVRDTYAFDAGPSIVTMPWVFEELFAETGAPLRTVLDLVPIDPTARYRFPDGTVLDWPRDPAAVPAALEAVLAPGSGRDWQRFSAHAAAVWAAVRGPFLESPLSGPADLARLSVRLRDLARIQPWRTLRDLGRRHLRDPRLRMVLDRYATYAGSDPRRAPAALATVPHVEQTWGTWYVRGGLHRLAEALRERACERGAEVRLGADVAAIELAGGRVAGVRLAGGERLRADVVVANADAAHVYGHLLPAAATVRARRRLAAVTPSLSGFALLLGLRGTTPDLPHHSVLFPRDYDAEFDALFGPRPRPVPDPTLYLSAPRDPSVAPPGDEAWFVLANAPRQGQVDWRAPGLAERYADRLLGLLAERGHDLGDRLASLTVRTPATLAEQTRAEGGAIYGTSSNGPRAAFLRPANRAPVPGLYLAGGSAHPGGGLPLVALSARITAALIGPA